MELLQCYNKGCGSKYDPSTNTSESCRYHPGTPVFHDAMKGWSCCKKRSTDFTEFLNFPGCTSGLHSNEKPVEPEKPKPEVDIPDSPEVEPKPEMMKQKVVENLTERPSEDEPLQRLSVTVTPSLQKALDKHLQAMSIQCDKDKEITNDDGGGVKVGESCKNNSCKATYQSPDSNNETCQYHPGVAIFHEGMKYWSCCQRKTSDFTNFLDQVGCELGKHVWIKAETEDIKKSCRVDWFQTSPDVNISVFAKVAEPAKTYVEVNQVVCNIHIVFEGGKSLFEQKLILRNPIIPEKSEVKLLGTKVEIILKKLEAFSWPSLELQQQHNNTENEEAKS